MSDHKTTADAWADLRGALHRAALACANEPRFWLYIVGLWFVALLVAIIQGFMR